MMQVSRLTRTCNNASGETGFHGQDVATDATFGGALQILDKTLRATSVGVERLFYHQGTINQGTVPNHTHRSVSRGRPLPSPPPRAPSGLLQTDLRRSVL